MNLTPEEKADGRENYYEAIGVSRRDFFQQTIATGAVGAAGIGAAYFGYTQVDRPVRIGVIGTGDEGNVLIGAMNPAYHQVVAIADIRPSSIHRAFHGDWASPAANAARKGLMKVYDWKTEDKARENVKVYDASNGGYEELLKDKDVEAIVIALPLHLHAKAAADAMKAGKHVLTEKLMAHNVAQCKAMGRIADEKDLYLAVGHQRHYSVLYDNAVNLIRWGILGEIHHIRAQWHRGNLPGRDSWQQPLPGGEPIRGSQKTYDKIADQLRSLTNKLKKPPTPEEAELLRKKVAQWTAWDSDKTVDAAAHGYESMMLPGDRERSALEELIRWRLWARTGGGLMAELGSHQLDAASIFISALGKDGEKAHPLNVHAVGGRHIFPYDREAEDHVYCMFEFPAPGYEPGFDAGYEDKVQNFPNPESGIPGYSEENRNKKIVVTYSSINGNGHGGYGEVVMGTKGTLILEREKEVMLFKKDTKARVGVKTGAGGPTMDTQASGDTAGPVAKVAEGPVSRGYTEELEHWAWCVRNQSPENKPRCNPKVALGDAVIALTTNVAIKANNKGKAGYVKFDEDWYDVNNDATPDGSDVQAEMKSLLG